MSIEIEGISHPTVLSYFEAMNSSAYDQVSDLFAIGGAMQPPFESQIVGRTAISQYLKQEARGIKADPQQGTVQRLENGDTEFIITGRVQTPIFGVNVSWQLILNSMDEILLAKVKLVASAKELLNLRPSPAKTE